MQTYIERKEAMAMLMALLNSRHPGDNSVFFMRSKFPTKLFNIKVYLHLYKNNVDADFFILGW
jgi:hypothetical protein